MRPTLLPSCLDTLFNAIALPPDYDPAMLAVEAVSLLVRLEALQGQFRKALKKPGLAVRKQPGPQSTTVILLVDHHEIDQVVFADCIPDDPPRPRLQCTALCSPERIDQQRRWQ